MSRTAERIAAAKAARRSFLYRIDMDSAAAHVAASADFQGLPVIDRGGYGIAFRASDDSAAWAAARKVAAKVGAKSVGLSSGLGVHRREIKEH